MIRVLLFLFLFLFVPTVFSQQNSFAEADQRAAKVPKKQKRSYKKLTHYLTDGLGSDEEKVRAIYMWMTENIRYDVYSYARGKNKKRSPDAILKRKKVLCNGYADLFEAMCTEAGIKNFQVTGYTKAGSYEPGDILVREDHVWNAVYYNDEWHLIDVTWGSGGIVRRKQIIGKFLFNKLHIPYIKKYRYIKGRSFSYLITDPKKLILDHLPAQPWWQLTEKIVPDSVFEKDTKDIQLFLNSGKGETNSCEANISVYEHFSDPFKTLFKAKRGNDFDEKNFDILAYGKVESAILWHNQSVKDRVDCSNKIKVNDSCSTLFKEAQKDLSQYNKFTLKEKETRVKKNTDFNQKAKKFSQQIIASNKQKINQLKSVDEEIDREIDRLKKEQESLKDEIKKLRRKQPNPAKKPIGVDSAFLANLQAEVDSLNQVKTYNHLEFMEKNVVSMEDNGKQICSASIDIKKTFHAKKKLRKEFEWDFQSYIDTLQEKQEKKNAVKDSLWKKNDEHFAAINALIKQNKGDYKTIRKDYKTLLVVANKTAQTELFKKTIKSWMDYDKKRIKQIDSCIAVYEKEEDQLSAVYKKIKKTFRRENTKNRTELRYERYRFRECNYFYNKFCKYQLQKSKRFLAYIKSWNKQVILENAACKKKMKEEAARQEKERKKREKEEKEGKGR
ncbi:MAG: transglutaminase domain-containing protein [Flavobacteriales bacterium]